MNTIFYFIRHGEVDNPKQIVYGRLPVHLSSEGKLQIKNLAEKFKKEGKIPNVIFSSDLVRTKESTTEILKVFPNTKVIYSENLEESDLGNLVGKSLEFQRSLGDVYNAKECEGMGIEKPKSVIDREMEVVTKAAKEYEGKTVFIVGHKDPLEFLMWKLTNPQAKEIPSIFEIEEKFQISKGEAWKFVLKENLRVENFKKAK